MRWERILKSQKTPLVTGFNAQYECNFFLFPSLYLHHKPFQIFSALLSQKKYRILLWSVQTPGTHFEVLTLPALSCTLDKAISVPRQARAEPKSALSCFGNTGRNSAIPILWPLTLCNRRKCKIHIEMGQGKARGQNNLWGAWIVNSVMCPPRGSGRVNNLTASLKELGKSHPPLRAPLQQHFIKCLFGSWLSTLVIFRLSHYL